MWILVGDDDGVFGQGLFSAGRFLEMKRVSWQYLTDTLLFISVVGVVIIGFLLAFVIPKGPSATDSAKYFLGLHRHEWGDIHLYLGISFTILAVLHLILGWNWVKGKTRGLFGAKWKGALLAICALPFAVLAAWWMVFPGESSIYGHDDTGAAAPDRGILDAGQLLPYNPTNTIPAVSADSETHSSSGKQPITTILESATNRRIEKDHRPDQHGNEEAGFTRGRGSNDTSGILITGQTTLSDIERKTGISARVLAGHLGLPRSASSDESLGRLRKRYPFTMQDVRDVISSLIEQRNLR